MNIAIVGCGYVADLYFATLPLHHELKVVALFDRDGQRSALMSQRYGVVRTESLQALLALPEVELVLNLTNPREHFAVSRAALDAGKHVYSEKPLAMELASAVELVALAERRGLLISCAPCSVLGESAQTLWRAVRERRVGDIRLVYAEMDDGMVHRMPYGDWLSASGLPWPHRDEFETGCTLEHAAYCLSWLVAMFGPARQVTAFSSTRIAEKVPGAVLDPDAPDFSVACIEFAQGVVARLTCSIVAPHDHELRLIGDEGVLSAGEVWDYRAPVARRRLLTLRRKTFLSPLRESLSLPRPPHGRLRRSGVQRMDFARGPAEVAAALREGRACRLSSAFSLHVNELTLAIHHARRDGASYRMTTSCPPMEPMPWAT
jgi:predicted dehydrogenase